MASYYTTSGNNFKPYPNGTLLLTNKETRQSGDLSNPGFEVIDVWQGHPTVVERARLYPQSYFNDYTWIKEITTSQQGPIWEITVTYGNVDLLSTWTLDSNMIEPRLSTHPNAIILDRARPGWTNMIEYIIDQHRFNKTDSVFDFRQIQILPETKFNTADDQGSPGTSDYPFKYHKPLPDADAVVVTGKSNQGVIAGGYAYNVGYDIDYLNLIALRYAQAWLLGQEAYQEPQWVIRNEVTVTAGFNFALWPKMFNNTNAMFTPAQMVEEPLLSGETIPGGIVVPGVPYWHKQPIQKVQTTDNQFVISREWYGRYWFNEFTYNLATV